MKDVGCIQRAADMWSLSEHGVCSKQQDGAGTDLQSDTDHVEGVFNLRVFGPVGEFLAQPDAQAAESHAPASTNEIKENQR